MSKNKTLKTDWELWDYDVWGNANDGYDVNDRFCFNRHYAINLKIEDNNPNTQYQFYSAYPTDYQIKKAFGIGCNITTEGDDTCIYINRERDNYPIGEMFCNSHESLSPIQINPDYKDTTK